MTSQINDGGPAFPVPVRMEGGSDGMSLRDYYIAHANITWAEAEYAAKQYLGRQEVSFTEILSIHAELCARQADEKLRARTANRTKEASADQTRDVALDVKAIRAAMVDELHRQGQSESKYERCHVYFAFGGSMAGIDGPVDLDLLAAAVLKAAGQS